MITAILAGLESLVGGAESGIDGVGGFGNLLGIFDVTLMIPTYWLQIVIGIYLVQIVFILTSTLVIIKSGHDELQTTAEIGRNLKKTMFLYFLIALISIAGLTLIGSFALAGLT